TLRETGDHATLGLLRELSDSADTRVEREVVQLTIDLLGSRPGIALSSLRLLVDDYLPWLERRSVHRAREAGTSWAGIARLLGVERQSVHQRFSMPAAMSDVLPPGPLRHIDLDEDQRRDRSAQLRRTIDADADDAAGGLVPW
ncbi:MAG: hypothetical protein ABJ314_09950, partial [Ilumatobacter sp.]